MPLAASNLVDEAWGAEQPPTPTAPIRVHPLQWAGQDVRAKLAGTREKLAAAKADVLVVTMLDEVAWLLNLRGSDVPFNPVFVAYALVSQQAATLYVADGKLGEEAVAQLKEAGVEVCEYGSCMTDLQQKAASGAALWMDPNKVGGVHRGGGKGGS